MNHTALVYLMGPGEGRFFGTLDYEEQPEIRLTAETSAQRR